MSEHSHQTYVEGCFRCDLSREEAEPKYTTLSRKWDEEDGTTHGVSPAPDIETLLAEIPCQHCGEDMEKHQRNHCRTYTPTVGPLLGIIRAQAATIERLTAALEAAETLFHPDCLITEPCEAHKIIRAALAEGE